MNSIFRTFYAGIRFSFAKALAVEAQEVFLSGVVGNGLYEERDCVSFLFAGHHRAHDSLPRTRAAAADARRSCACRQRY